MRKKIATAALIGSIGLTGGLLVGPGFAAAADSTSTSTGVSGRFTALKDALQGLVSDNTITQAQADKVATTLDQKLPHRSGPGRFRGGPHGGRAHLAAAQLATILGLTPAELRTQLRAGKTLTQIATAQGISKTTLIDKLVAAAKADLAQAVKDGRLTQARADAISRTLTQRITAGVDKVGGQRSERHRSGANA